jgi:hypothetical protein
MPQAIEALPDDPNELKAMLLAKRARNERLVQIIKEMQRHRFGRRAETLPEDQMLLALEDVVQTEAGAAAQEESRSAAVRAETARQRRRNRGALPAHLPHIEAIVDIEDKACPCCKGLLHRIGEDVSVRLKGLLCNVETYNANLFHGCPLRSWDAQASPPWHIAMPSGGGIRSITYVTVRICEDCSLRPSHARRR